MQLLYGLPCLFLITPSSTRTTSAATATNLSFKLSPSLNTRKTSTGWSWFITCHKLLQVQRTLLVWLCCRRNLWKRDREHLWEKKLRQMRSLEMRPWIEFVIIVHLPLSSFQSNSLSAAKSGGGNWDYLSKINSTNLELTVW